MTQKPLILWLTKDNNANLPSLRLRIIKLEPYIAEKFRQLRTPAPLGIIQLFKTIPLIRKADIVIIQKQLLSPLLLLIIRAVAKKLYFDFDDSVHIRHTKNGDYKVSRKCRSRFKFVCSIVDAAIAGNSFLKEKAEEYGAKKVFILPTALAIQSPPGQETNNETITLGWIGTAANLPYLEEMEPVFLQLMSEHKKFRLSIMCDKPPKFESFTEFKFTKWSAAAEMEFLNQIDIGLMPLADNEHTRGKCAYKALQYMSFGKPVVVSDVGINAQWTHGAGYATKNNEEMVEAINKLMASEKTRRELGEEGKRIVDQYFSEQVISQRLINILETPERTNPDFPLLPTQSAL